MVVVATLIYQYNSIQLFVIQQAYFNILITYSYEKSGEEKEKQVDVMFIKYIPLKITEIRNTNINKTTLPHHRLDHLNNGQKQVMSFSFPQCLPGARFH